MDNMGHEQLRVVVDKNESQSWARGSICYEQLRTVDDINNSWLWAMTLNYPNNIGLWMTWMTLGSEFKALDATNNLGLWLTWKTPGH